LFLSKIAWNKKRNISPYCPFNWMQGVWTVRLGKATGSLLTTTFALDILNTTTTAGTGSTPTGRTTTTTTTTMDPGTAATQALSWSLLIVVALISYSNVL
jgi:hypothetical protein